MPTDIKAVKFDDLKTIQPKQFAISWLGLEASLTHSIENTDKTKRDLWSPVEYYHLSTRGNRNVKNVTCLVVDMDGESFDYAKLDGLEYLAYTTWSHEPGNEHWHLVLPLAKPVPGHIWSDVWVQLLERINVAGDPQTKDPARIFYRPQHRPGVVPGFKRQHGAFLDAGDFSTFRSVHSFRSPKTATSRGPHGSRRVAEILDERWWTDPQDLSRFNGMTQTEIAQSLLVEFRELRKSLNLH
jgi:hypothetical protein